MQTFRYIVVFSWFHDILYFVWVSIKSVYSVTSHILKVNKQYFLVLNLINPLKISSTYIFHVVLNTINKKNSIACQPFQIFMKLCLLSFTVEVWKTLMVFSENSEVVTGFGDIIVVESKCLRRMAESLKKHCCLVSVISNGNINPF